MPTGVAISNAQAAAIANGTKTAGQVRNEVANRSAERDNRVVTKASDMYSILQGIAQDNNAWSAKQAEIARQFSADEAEKNRKWQEYMSNTAHQREIKDLKAAGLNPVLSAMGGNGAAVTSGATASSYMGQTDMSLAGGIVSLMGSLLNSQTQLVNKALDAQTNLAVADKYNATNRYLGELSSATQLSTANIHAMATKYAADTGASASVTSAAIHAAAQKYGYDVSAMTQRDIAGFNATVNAYLQDDKQAHEFDLKAAYPSNIYEFGTNVVDGIFGSEGMTDYFRNGFWGKLNDWLTAKDGVSYSGAGGRR